METLEKKRILEGLLSPHAEAQAGSASLRAVLCTSAAALPVTTRWPATGRRGRPSQAGGQRARAAGERREPAPHTGRPAAALVSRPLPFAHPGAPSISLSPPPAPTSSDALAYKVRAQI